MFDELQPQKPVEDIFDKVDTNTQPVDMPTTSAPQLDNGQVPTTAKGSKTGLIIAIVVVVVLIIIGVAGYFIYSFLTIAAVEVQQPADNAIVEPVNTPEPVPEPIVPSVVEQESVKVATFDTDKDGLTDSEEVTLGTNPNQVDSDSDGLFDYDEVKVYKTDPLNPDTDGDSFADGQEVISGYNPNGPGKLLDFDKAKADLVK